MDSISWNIIDKYFTDNPYNLVAHHLDSYNDFFTRGIFQIFKENNPIRYIERNDSESETIDSSVRNQILLYMGGKDGTKLYFGKPVIYDENTLNEISKPYSHYLYPNDARLRSMTYGITIHYDIDVDYKYYIGEEKKEYTNTIEKVYLGRFPIMLHSNLCILKGLSVEARFNLGECRNDMGGYFIIDGKEKVIVCQEKFANNMLYIRQFKDEDALYSYSSEIRSVSEDASKPIRYTSVRIVAPDKTYTNNQIVVDIPNIRKPIPLFIVMRALGVISDKNIIEYCLLDLKQNEKFIDLFIPSVHDAQTIFSQQVALEFMASFTKNKTVSSLQDILMNYFLPHIGEDNYLDKAYFIGFMVLKMLKVFLKQEKPTDRDNFKFKRVETSGTLIYQLFREYYLLQKKQIGLTIDKLYYYHIGQYRNNFPSLIENNTKDIFKERIVEKGFQKGFKGNWGAEANTKRLGVVQDLNRLSWFTFISHLRKLSLHMEASSKAVAPHLLHASQWGYIDPVDTPDGGNVGLHKHMAISTAITNGFSSFPLIKWLRSNTPLKLLQECNSSYIAFNTKVFVNGNWIGVLDNPIETIYLLKLYRRNGVIPVFTSMTFSYEENIIYLYTDDGRVSRPIFYRLPNGKVSYDIKKVLDILESRQYKWEQLIAGFKEKEDSNFNVKNNFLYDTNILYNKANNKELLDFLEANKGIVDYIDTSEEENSYIANNPQEFNYNKFYTHSEIDPSLIFGVMGNSITFPENNQLPRDVFSCGQSKQAVSVFHSNYQMRIDKMGVILNYGQKPLIKSKYLEYINHEQQPYGVNTIVAIMSYTGYNVEDAILINEGSLKRGLFNTTYFSMYEAHEESSKVSGATVNSFFTNIESKQNISGLKPGYDYSHLDKHGLIKENTPLDDKMILIGQLTSTTENKDMFIDNSVKPKKGQLGFVDKSFMTEGEEGFRIAKIRIREERIPAIGDKMASRNGQKGTIGLIIPEQDMPFTSDGIRPDLIINPHALPSRMTIGQLIECLFGKACASYGAFGDCTAFSTKGANTETYGHMLTKAGFHSSGNQIMYNGQNGEQIYSEIFLGPTYYMRLKHMVKDKINYRALGPRTVLTRQTVQGRANDGGLRIGEMERDGILAHGASYFLTESYMVRGDQYFMAVCNKSGAIAIYNPSLNLFLSPFADGPLVFNKTIEGKLILDVFSIYGRSFSIIKIPYALKLLIQELQVMNIQMRLITEDNVDQLLNLSYQSHNLENLLHLDEEIPKEKMDEFLNSYKKQLNNKINKIDEEIMKEKQKQQDIKNQEKEEEQDINENVDLDPELDNIIKEELNQDQDQDSNESVPFAPGSPAYMPGSDEFIEQGSQDSNYFNPNQSPNDSLQYAPGSPAYMPSPGELPQVDSQESNYYNPNFDFDNVNYLKTVTDLPIVEEKKENDILSVEEPVLTKTQTDTSVNGINLDKTETESDSTRKIIVL
jgi:DNA-directed RNA polymerase II subunit RPB2